MSYTFISGATGGIGKAFARACAVRGENLFITGRDAVKLSAEKDALISAGAGQTEFFACDLTDKDSRDKMLAYIDEKGIKFARIVNVAGVDTQKPFTEYTAEKILFQIRVNVESTVALTHALLKRREIPAAEIITIGSMSGVSPMPYFALYSASKAFLENLFTALHYELKPEGVKVTTVLPGGVPTRADIIEEIKGQGVWGKLSSKSPEFVAEKSLKAVKKNKIVYIPGFFNRFLHFVMKIAPKKAVLCFIARRWKNHRKDAF